MSHFCFSLTESPSSSCSGTAIPSFPISRLPLLASDRPHVLSRRTGHALGDGGHERPGGADGPRSTSFFFFFQIACPEAENLMRWTLALTECDRCRSAWSRASARRPSRASWALRSAAPSGCSCPVYALDSHKDSLPHVAHTRHDPEEEEDTPSQLVAAS